MSYWDDSSDILQKGKGGNKRLFPKPSRKNPNPIPQGATEYTPKTGEFQGVTHKVVDNTPLNTKGATGLDKKEQKSHVWFKPPGGKMSYQRGPSARESRRIAKDRGLDVSGSPTSAQVKKQHEKDSPSAWREFGDLTQVFGDGKSTPYGNPIPERNKAGAAFRENVRKDLLSRQTRLQQNIENVRSRWNNSGGKLSSGAQVFKKMIERLPKKAQKQIMDTYRFDRIEKLKGKEGLQLAGLPTRFQNPAQYKKLAGFYYNPHGLEYAMSLGAADAKQTLSKVGRMIKRGANLFIPGKK